MGTAARKGSAKAEDQTPLSLFPVAFKTDKGGRKPAERLQAAFLQSGIRLGRQLAVLRNREKRNSRRGLPHHDRVKTKR